MRAQQQRFDRWRKEFNLERPHEGGDLRIPAELYQPSVRRLDESIKMPLYDLGVTTRKVSQSGLIAHNNWQCFVGRARLSRMKKEAKQVV